VLCRHGDDYVDHHDDHAGQVERHGMIVMRSSADSQDAVGLFAFTLRMNPFRDTPKWGSEAKR